MTLQTLISRFGIAEEVASWIEDLHITQPSPQMLARFAKASAQRIYSKEPNKWHEIWRAIDNACPQITRNKFREKGRHEVTVEMFQGKTFNGWKVEKILDFTESTEWRDRTAICRCEKCGAIRKYALRTLYKRPAWHKCENPRIARFKD